MLVDCDTTNGGCNGGMYDRAWQFLQGKGGAMKSASYAYTSGTTGTVRKCFLSIPTYAPQLYIYPLLTLPIAFVIWSCRLDPLANSPAPPLAPRFLLSAGSSLTPTPPPSWPVCKATGHFPLPLRSRTPSTATRKMKWRRFDNNNNCISYFDPIY